MINTADINLLARTPLPQTALYTASPQAISPASGGAEKSVLDHANADNGCVAIERGWRMRIRAAMTEVLSNPAPPNLLAPTAADWIDQR